MTNEEKSRDLMRNLGKVVGLVGGVTFMLASGTPTKTKIVKMLREAIKLLQQVVKDIEGGR